MQRQDREIHGDAGRALGGERRVERPTAAHAGGTRMPGMNSEVSSSAKDAGSSQNEMLFMRGKAMSGAPIISGTIQLPKPPIIDGMTMKNTMMRPCAVT